MTLNIRACHILPDSRIMILDNNQKQLVLFSNDGIFIRNVVTFTKNLCDVCFVRNYTVAVTLRSANQIAVVDVEKNKIIQTIKLSHECYGVADGKAFVITSGGAQCTTVNLNDMSHTILEGMGGVGPIALFHRNIYGILVQLIVTHAEECPYEDLLTLNNEKGKDYAVVNPELFPGAYNFFPELPTRVDEDPGKQFFVYYVGNDTVCWLNVVVKIVRCKQEVSNISDYEGGANCSNLLWGTSCNAACSDGKVSMGGPAVFTCEMDNYNMTYLQLDNDTVCQDSAYALKCPEDISIYTDSSYLAVASITLDEWTFPTSLDSNGKPWKIESQTAEETKYLIGTYTNIVTATSSTGEISSCKFDFIIKLLGCTVPQVDESTIERAVPNKTYHISIYSYDYEKKICKQGYGWKQNENNKDFVEVKCVETSPGHPEWKNWNSRNCTKNEIPKICGREVILDGKKTEVVYFSYDFMEWKSLAEQNITSCKFRAVVDVYKPPMYDLEMTFQTDTSMPLTADKCFFEVLLYAGESSLGSPIKVRYK
ncbi:uncharacterized protein [Mytilus edulis]|uniref:uncharacterized protein n=1 Tax=Mytilus edulis TaxID=6550 RepID=UPI0039F00210